MSFRLYLFLIPYANLMLAVYSLSAFAYLCDKVVKLNRVLTDATVIPAVRTHTGTCEPINDVTTHTLVLARSFHTTVVTLTKH